MAVQLSRTGAAKARALIADGQFDDKAAWSFSAADGDALLGAKGDDWANYAAFHLGEDTAATDKTKARWKYPFGKAGKVYGEALRAIRSRAAQEGANAVYAEAGKLLDLVKKGKSAAAASGYRVLRNAAAASAEIYIYGPIGASMCGDGITANRFRTDLQALGTVKTLDVRLNSEGGDVFDGKAIYALLVEHQAKVTMHVDGLAASAASFICMAGDTIEMAEGAFMMIHDAWAFCAGTADDMTRMAALLTTVNGTIADVYAARTGQSKDQVASWMADETWMTAADCVDRKFADRLSPNLQVAAAVRDASRFRNLPAALRPRRAAAAAELVRIAAARR
jgi:ATP-dependent protease ClpP protease subunit